MSAYVLRWRHTDTCPGGDAAAWRARGARPWEGLGEQGETVDILDCPACGSTVTRAAASARPEYVPVIPPPPRVPSRVWQPEATTVRPPALGAAS